LLYNTTFIPSQISADGWYVLVGGGPPPLGLDGQINLQTDLVFYSRNISTRKVTSPVFYLLCLGKTLVDKKSN